MANDNTQIIFTEKTNDIENLIPGEIGMKTIAGDEYLAVQNSDGGVATFKNTSSLKENLDRMGDAIKEAYNLNERVTVIEETIQPNGTVSVDASDGSNILTVNPTDRTIRAKDKDNKDILIVDTNSQTIKVRNDNGGESVLIDKPSGTVRFKDADKNSVLTVDTAHGTIRTKNDTLAVDVNNGTVKVKNNDKGFLTADAVHGTIKVQRPNQVDLLAIDASSRDIEIKDDSGNNLLTVDAADKTVRFKGDNDSDSLIIDSAHGTIKANTVNKENIFTVNTANGKTEFNKNTTFLGDVNFSAPSASQSARFLYDNTNNELSSVLLDAPVQCTGDFIIRRKGEPDFRYHVKSSSNWETIFQRGDMSEFLHIGPSAMTANFFGGSASWAQGSGYPGVNISGNEVRVNGILSNTTSGIYNAFHIYKDSDKDGTMIHMESENIVIKGIEKSIEGSEMPHNEYDFVQFADHAAYFDVPIYADKIVPNRIGDEDTFINLKIGDEENRAYVEFVEDTQFNHGVDIKEDFRISNTNDDCFIGFNQTTDVNNPALNINCNTSITTDNITINSTANSEVGAYPLINIDAYNNLIDISNSGGTYISMWMGSSPSMQLKCPITLGKNSQIYVYGQTPMLLDDSGNINVNSIKIQNKSLLDCMPKFEYNAATKTLNITSASIPTA